MRTRGCCIEDVGIPIPKTLVIWASPVTVILTLTQIAEVIRGMPISLEFWDGDAYITVTLTPSYPILFPTTGTSGDMELTMAQGANHKLCYFIGGGSCCWLFCLFESHLCV